MPGGSGMRLPRPDVTLTEAGARPWAAAARLLRERAARGAVCTVTMATGGPRSHTRGCVRYVLLCAHVVETPLHLSTLGPYVELVCPVCGAGPRMLRRRREPVRVRVARTLLSWAARRRSVGALRLALRVLR